MITEANIENYVVVEREKDPTKWDNSVAEINKAIDGLSYFQIELLFHSIRNEVNRKSFFRSELL